MRARNACLNNNGGWCVKIFENYVVRKEKYNLLSNSWIGISVNGYAVHTKLKLVIIWVVSHKIAYE